MIQISSGIVGKGVAGVCCFVDRGMTLDHRNWQERGHLWRREMTSSCIPLWLKQILLLQNNFRNFTCYLRRSQILRVHLAIGGEAILRWSGIATLYVSLDEGALFFQPAQKTACKCGWSLEVDGRRIDDVLPLSWDTHFC